MDRSLQAHDPKLFHGMICPKRNHPVMGQSCPAQTLVAQVSNRLYRGFPIRRRRETLVSHRSPAVSRLEVGDTADWKSALQPGETDPLHDPVVTTTFLNLPTGRVVECLLSFRERVRCEAAKNADQFF